MARSRGTPNREDANSDGSRSSRRDFGDGSVYERGSDGRWIAQLVISQHPKKFKRQVAPRSKNTRQEALKILDQLKRERDTGLDTTSGKMVLHAWMEYYLETVWRIDEKAPNTRDDALYLTQYLILPELGKAAIRSLTTEQLERWRDARLKDYAPSVVKRAAGLLKRALADAHERGALPRNPAYRLTKFDAPTAAPIPLTVKQTDTLVELVEEYNVGAAILCSVRLGLRIGEALALRWIDYNRAERTLKIGRQLLEQPGIVYGPTKNKLERIIPVPPGLAAFLDRWYERTGTSILICPSEQDTPITHRNARRALESIITRANYGEIVDMTCPECGKQGWETYAQLHQHRRRAHKVKLKPASEQVERIPSEVTWHDLRHTTGARLTDLGASEAIIAAILGHIGGSVTALYSHAEVEALRIWIAGAELGQTAADRWVA